MYENWNFFFFFLIKVNFERNAIVETNSNSYERERES